MTALAHAGLVTGRHLRALARQPWYLAFTLVQPLVYLLLFGALFEKASQIPGFAGDDYLTFLVPGVVVTSALFSSFWNGMGMLEDIERGTLDRMLASPVRPVALVVGPIAQGAVSVVVQCLVIVGIAELRGAELRGGLPGVAVLVLAAVLLAVPFAAFSNAVALAARSRDAMIGAVNFLALPATFTASAFLPVELAPGWVQAIAAANPVEWAVTAGRAAVTGGADPAYAGVRLAGLAAVAAAMTGLATRAFGAYRRSA